MRPLTLFAHVSLDGILQSSDDGDGFPYPDWTAPYRTPEGREAVMAVHGERFDLLLGRRTYDLWSAFWPTAPSNPLSDRFNAATKYVATHRPESLAWGPHAVIGGDVVADVQRLTAEDGPPLIVAGSSSLTTTILAHGLADRVVLIVYPVLLGTGKRLFASDAPAQRFTLVRSQAFATGVQLQEYTAAGALPTAGAAR